MRSDIEDLRHMTVPQLRHRWAELFGEATRCNHRDYLIKRLAWRVQAMADGGISERARQRAREIANEADLRFKSPRTPAAAYVGTGERTVTGTLRTARDPRLPMPGAVLTRVCKGRRINVRVLISGFEFSGQGVTPNVNGDLNRDGTVNTADLTTLLGAFGHLCP